MMQPLSRFSFRTGALLAGMLACVSVSQAQNLHWKIVGSFAGTMCPYFLNDSIGFAYNNSSGISGGPGNGNATFPNLFKTTNGGITWISTVGQFPVNAIDMYFVSPLHGYAACNTNFYSTATGGGIFETTNGGTSWRRITPDAMTHTSGVYPLRDTLYASNPSLFFSTDDGLTWSTSIMTKVGPSAGFQGTVTGNLDYSILSPDGGHGDDSGAIFSSDGGNSWHRGSKLNAAYSACMIPHTLECFRSDEESPDPSAPPGQYIQFNGGKVGHSTDGGATWFAQNVPGQPYLTGGITNGGCHAVYVQRTPGALPDSGLVRTTDHGQTWVSVGGPSGFLDHKLCAVGTGATVFAMDAYHNIWKTTDGGDGALSASDWPSLSVAHLGTPNDTLITKLCDSAGFQFTLTNSGCLRYWLDSVAIDGIGPNAYYTVLHNRYVGDGQPSDTALVTILPKKSGTYPLTIHGRLRREDWLELDTTFHLTLIINDNPGVLDLAAKPLYDFGVQSLCKPHVVTDSFSVSGHGCEAVTVDSIVFQPISGSGFTFKKVKSFIAPDTATGTVAIHFPISYKPAAAETDSGIIIIHWSSPGSQPGDPPRRTLQDTLILRGAAVADSRSFVIASDTLSTRMCDSATGTVALQNPTCNAMEIDSISLPAGLTLLTPLPVVMDTASERTLSIRVAPGAGNGQAGTLALHVGDTVLPVTMHIVGTTPFDTTVMLHVRVARGVPAASISVAALNFDTVSTCSEKTLAVVISSTGCDTLHCSGAVSAPTFRVVGADPGALAVGTTDTMWITFASQTAGTFFDTLIITSSAGTETVPLQAIAVSDRIAIATAQSKDTLRATANCTGDSAEISLQNLGCKAIGIDSVNSPAFPRRGPGGGSPADTLASDSIWRTTLIYTPTQPGQQTSPVHLYFHGADGIEHDTTYTLSASAIAPPILAMHLRSSAVSAPPDNTIAIPVYASSSQPTSVNSLSFRLNMRTDLVTPERVTTIAGGAGTAPLQVDGSGANITIGFPSGFALSADTLLATVVCAVYVTDTMQTPIALTQQSASSISACLSIDSTSPPITFTLVPLCGDSAIMRAMQSRLFEIESIRPNPASGELDVTLSRPTGTTVAYELYDALGTTRLRGVTQGSDIALDVSSLPEGVYFFRASTDGASSVSRKIAISR